MRDPIVIDFNKLEIYEAGALLVTWLTYPEQHATDEQRGGLPWCVTRSGNC